MKHILVVDDDRVNLAYAKKALENRYKVTPVVSGEQALAFLEKHRPDLILLDIKMPDIDGIETMRRIQANGMGDIPIIFLTASTDSDTEYRCLEMGARDFISKPFSTAVMNARIDRFIELEELRKRLETEVKVKTSQVRSLERETEVMRSRTHKDALSGLWDRIYTEEAISEHLANGGTGTLFIIDMDNFKYINDIFGHQAGDDAIRRLSALLVEHSSENDILCRLGGDEFIMFVADDTSRVSLSQKASRIMESIRENLVLPDGKTPVSVSAGAAVYPDDGADFDELYKNADKSLYYVKLNGKNSFHFFSDERDKNSGGDQSAGLRISELREKVYESSHRKGIFHVDYNIFRKIYTFLERNSSRSPQPVQTLLFTLTANDGSLLSDAALADGMKALENAVAHSLREGDVCTEYSENQLIVLLINASTGNGIVAAERTAGRFRSILSDSNITGVRLSYDIEDMMLKGDTGLERQI